MTAPNWVRIWFRGAAIYGAIALTAGMLLAPASPDGPRLEPLAFGLTALAFQIVFWIIGGDQLPKLHLWRDIAELAKLVQFIFLERPGYPVKAEPGIPGLRLHRCDGHLLAISSTELRERTRLGLSLDYFVPHKAIIYIRQHDLYRESQPSTHLPG